MTPSCPRVVPAAARSAGTTHFILGSRLTMAARALVSEDQRAARALRMATGVTSGRCRRASFPCSALQQLTRVYRGR